MEETKKSSKGIIVLVIILIVCILVIGGYIVYDKMLNKQTQTTDNTKSSTTKSINNDDKNYDIELKNLKFPNRNDDNVLVYGLVDEFIDSNIKNSLDKYKNYKNIHYMINGFNFKESCTYFYIGKDEPSICKNSEMTINEKIKINFALDIPYSEQKFMLITDKNIIVQKSLGAIRLGDIEIYDYQGNLIKTIKNTTTYLVLRGDNCEVLYESKRAYNMILMDNKLHYIDAINGAIYKTLDLETYEENIIGTINAFTTQEC